MHFCACQRSENADCTHQYLSDRKANKYTGGDWNIGSLPRICDVWLSGFLLHSDFSSVIHPKTLVSLPWFEVGNVGE